MTSQVIVTVNKSKRREAQDLKQLMHREAGPIIRDQITKYLRCLKDGVLAFSSPSV